jgi:hypothetical protein
VTGCIASQQALIIAHTAYLTATEEHRKRGTIWHGVEADRAHSVMFLAAMRAGFYPAHLHKHLPCLEWVEHRVRVLAEIMPNHVREARRAA